MAVEIELKAHLDDFAPVKARLSAMGEYCRSYTKSDSYWFPAQMGAGIRIRRESGTNADGTAYESVLVTYKQKEISGGIEVNDESEFTVSDGLLFEALLARLGLSKDICKEKQGWAWAIPPHNAPSGENAPPILAELSQVRGLGWFLEIEIMVADNSGHTVEENRGRLLALLEKLEIPADRIESRPYAEMLRENAKI